MVRRETTLRGWQRLPLMLQLGLSTLLLTAVTMCTSSDAAAADPNRVIYVDAAAQGANDGSCWKDACTYLQDALTLASTAKKPIEIWVAQGTYKPDSSSAHPNGTGSPDVSFILLDNVTLKGGFAGVSAPDPNTRDIRLYKTILSGDLAGDDVPVVDPCDLLAESAYVENSHGVIRAGHCSRSAVLDGLAITSGNAIGTRLGSGAALYLSGSSSAPCCPSIRDCTFTGNLSGAGGAVYVDSAYPEIVNCTFTGNASGVEGGAIDILLSSSSTSSACQLVIRGCTFDNNYTRGVGGAIHLWDAPLVIEACTFASNMAKKGGALYVASPDARPNVVNCRFMHNVADEAGSAVYFKYEKGLNMNLCTLLEDESSDAGAIACLEPLRETLAVPSATITNTILWGTDHPICVFPHVQTNVTYTDIRGGWPGAGNIDADPLFVDPNTADLHLKSQAGRWDPNSQSWGIDDVTSPCIDAGDPNSPVGDEAEPNGGRINMGTYGGTAEASKSPSTGG